LSALLSSSIVTAQQSDALDVFSIPVDPKLPDPLAKYRAWIVIVGRENTRIEIPRWRLEQLARDDPRISPGDVIPLFLTATNSSGLESGMTAPQWIKIPFPAAPRKQIPVEMNIMTRPDSSRDSVEVNSKIRK